MCVLVSSAKSPLHFHSSSLLVCKGFTPSSFKICFACTIKLFHHQPLWHGRRRKAQELTRSRTCGERGLINHFLSRKPPLVLFIHDSVTKKWTVVISGSGWKGKWTSEHYENLKAAWIWNLWHMEDGYMHIICWFGAFKNPKVTLKANSVL